MDRIYHSTPSFDRYQAPDPAAVATGKIVKYKETTPKKAPRKSKGKGKEKQEGEHPQEVVAAPEVPSVSTSKATYETVRPIVEEVKHDISRPQFEKKKEKETDSKGQAHTAVTPSAKAKMAPSSHDTISSSSSKRKRDKEIKSSHRKEKRGRSSSRGPPPKSKSSRKKSRKETSSPESSSSTGSSSDSESSGSEEEDDEDSSSEESRAAEEQEKLRRKRARSSSKGRSKSVTRGRARSKSRGRYSDSESDTDSSPDGTPFKQPIFMAVTGPNGDTRVRKIDPAIHFPDLLELCYALSNIHQETPIHLSYKLEKLTVQLKDEEDLKAMLEAAILRELQVHIRIQKVEASPLPSALPPATNVVVSNGAVDTPQAKKRKTGPRKVADTENREAKGGTSSVQAVAQRDSETSDEEPLSTFKAETTQNGHPSISLQGKDNVPLAKVVIKEAGEGSRMKADAGSVAPVAKSSEMQGEIAGVGDASVPAVTAVKKEKRKRRSAEQIRLDNEKKEAEKAAKVAAKEAAKEAKKEERKKARQAEKAAAKAEKQKLDREEAEQAERAKRQREDEERKVEEEKKANEERERKVREEEEAKKASEAEAAAKKKQTQEAKTKAKAKKSPDGKDGKVEAQKKSNGVESSNIAATPSKEQLEDNKTKAVKEKGRKEKTAEDETVEPSTTKEKSASDSPAKKDEGSKKMSPVKKAGAAAATEGKDSSTTSAPAKSVSNANGSAVPAVGKEAVPAVKKSADVNGAASTKEANSRPVKAKKIHYKCHICFAQDHSMMQCPIIGAGTRAVESRLHQLKEKKKHKTKMENEACKLLEGWLQSNRQHEEKEKQGLMLFRRTHPDHEISKALSEQERQEDEEEQREINAAMERERQRIKERAEKTRTPSMSPTAGRESVKDIIDKVHRGGAGKGGGQRDAVPNVGKSPSPIKGLDASSEVDQLEGTQSSPGLYPPLPRSVSKKGPLSSPTPSESELATSPMLMASGGLKNPLMDNIKEVSLPASAEASEQEGQVSDRSSDTSDDSADEDELESDDEAEEGRSGEKAQRAASESIATSSDREENVGQEEDEDEVDEEEEEDQIEATPAPAKPNAKSGWMPSLGSIFGLKSSQDLPISQRETMTETQESGPPSAQRSRVGVAGAKAEPVTPSFSSRPRLAGGTRLSELDTSKVRSSFSQPNTPIGIASSQPTTAGKSSVSAKRKAEISFDTDSEDDHSEDSDSDNEAKRPSASLPLAKRAGQKQSKRPRSSLLAKMTPS